jgi:drug/metabolite transporter (DMT)-like permease
MSWFAIVLIAQAANAVALFLDKFILSKRVARPLVLTFWTVVAGLLGVIFIFGNFIWWPGSGVVLVALIAGAIFTAALYLLYLGMERGEASHISPLSGAIVPLASIIFSYYLLNEVLSGRQFLAVLFLAVGALLVSIESSDRYHGWHLGMLYAVLAGFLFALSYVLSRVLYLQTTFATAFVWRIFGSVVVVLPLLLFSKLRREIFSFNRQASKVSGKNLLILAVNKGLAAVYFIGMNIAIALTSATIVNALSGLQYVLLFVLIYLISRFAPRIFREKFTKLELARQVVAMVLIGVGLYLII